MATNDSEILRPIDPSDSTATIFDTINRDFRVLASRIKSLNQNFSYLDMMRIAVVFTSDSTDDSAILTQFISTAWASLDNYAGVYIRLTGIGAYFKLDDNTIVKNGDYVVKLPGNQFLHIDSASPVVFVPTYNAGTPFTITFEQGGTAPSTAISFPTLTSSNMIVWHQENISPYNSLKKTNGTTVLTDSAVRDVRWYDSSTKEEVVWSKHYVGPLGRNVEASYCSATNPTALTLDATFIYDDLA